PTPPTPFPYTTLFRSCLHEPDEARLLELVGDLPGSRGEQHERHDEHGTRQVHERVGIEARDRGGLEGDEDHQRVLVDVVVRGTEDRKSTRLNSSHVKI